MDTILWSRLQFAMTAAYHWLFVPLTLGLALVMAIMETLYVVKKDDFWRKTAQFWMKVFAVNFAVGIATGIILEFEFGTNWSNYSWFVGDMFGAPLAIEGILAFFMEATFFAVMFFGWDKVKDDPSGAGYNVAQSMIAIGSGRFLGKGYLQGTQTKLHFVPEQDTDFIFCTVGEEWGFVGSAGVLILYLIFILRLIAIAERQRDNFSQIYCYSVASIFMTHLIINVGMVLGLLPVIGIPLPFFSYGGSSMMGFSLLLFILLKLDATRVEKLH